MKISFYAPFKPLNHANPSGDLVTATGIVDFLTGQGHTVTPVSSVRCRWIYWKPWLWPGLFVDRQRAIRHCRSERPDLWLTYHSYYKAPDLIGPGVGHAAGVPYVIFQGIYATKRRRRLATRAGFYLNRHALKTANHIFTNKPVDFANLKRIVPETRLTYIPPAICPDAFTFDPEARSTLRSQWNVADDMPVVLSVAMFRPGVKTEGLSWVIRACARLARKGQRLKLVLVGDGKEKSTLEALAAARLPGQIIFAGKIDRGALHRYYSAADLFAFPGIQESLGMVYLEAQSCGLPVAAVDNAGVAGAVKHGRTGLLAPAFSMDRFTDHIGRLITDTDFRQSLGQEAQRYIRQHHDLEVNYRGLETKLAEIAAAGTKKR